MTIDEAIIIMIVLGIILVVNSFKLKDDEDDW